MSLFDAEMKKGATFSSCRTFRYSLWREWDSSKESLTVIGLNPSTADESLDDPTIRKCIGFAQRWGYGKLVMLNLFALRSTDPDQLMAYWQNIGDPVGPENDAILLEATAPRTTPREILCAWGNGGKILDRARAVKKLLSGKGRVLTCLGQPTKQGQPQHPLYVAYDTPRNAFA